MQEFSTYIFEPSKKKARKRLVYNGTIILAICIIIYLSIIGILGIGITIIGAISLIATLLKMKIYDDKYMGITAYGDRGARFIITENSFKLGDSILLFEELEKLIIYVDEYAGMSKDLYGVHHGGKNEIKFNYKGQQYQLNYIIKNKADFQRVEKLVEKIEETYQ